MSESMHCDSRQRRISRISITQRLMVPRDLYDKTGGLSSASLVEPGSNANRTSRTRSVTFGPGFDQMAELNLWFGLAFGKFAPRTRPNRTSAALHHCHSRHHTVLFPFL